MACQPVIAIGWTELAIILVILIVLFAPLLFRVFRFFIQNKAPSDHENE
ncbi:MAG: twin-arginine translocase TatA/TatE family subunit [Anaerolineales bacterium]